MNGAGNVSGLQPKKGCDGPGILFRWQTGGPERINQGRGSWDFLLYFCGNAAKYCTMKNSTALLFLLTAMAATMSCSRKPFVATAPPASYGQAADRIKETSILNIPVEVPLAEIEKKINEQLGTVLFEDNSLENNGGDNLMLKVTRRLPLRIEAKGGNLFGIQVPVNIWAKAGWKVEKFGLSVAKYEDTQFDVDFNFLTRLSLDKNWNINTSTVPNGYRWVSEPKVKIGFFEIPITTIIEKIMERELPGVVKAVDAETGKIDLKPRVETAWKAVQEPFLMNEAYQAWLKVTPQEILMTPLGNKGQNVRVGIGMKAVTETYVGSKPGAAVMAVLPPLKIVEKMDEKFEVGMVTEISYGQLKKMAMDQTGGKTYEFKDGKYKITVVDVDIYGQGADVVVATTLSGSLNGKVYLKGKPYYDAASTSIKVKDLDYDLDTRNRLARTADWMAHGKFLSMMEPYFSYSVAAQLEEGKKMIQENLAGNKMNRNLNLNGKLNELIPGEMAVTPNGIRAIITARGRLDVQVSGF